MNRTAQVVSIALNPLIVIIAMSYILTFSWFWGFITAVFIILLSILIWILVRKKVFSNFDVSLQSQRPRLHLLELAAALIYLAIIYSLHSPTILLVQAVNIILILIGLFFVNRFVKASGHMAIFAGSVTMLAFLYDWFYLSGFLLVGILAWSRLRLKRHSLKEVVAGLIIGIVLTVFIIVI